MREFEPHRFECYMNHATGQFNVFYHGQPVPEWGGSGGSRQFFCIDKDFFVKCAYGEYGSQCKTEAYLYADIEAQDRKYFPELLYACDFKGAAHWTVWRYVDLVSFVSYDGYDEAVFDRCNRKVEELCSKYRIADVRGFVNGNWWIHNNEPLIVDLGCDY